MKRHNGWENYLKSGCEQRGNTVHAEPLFDGPNGALKPDLVVYGRDQIAVIDVQVVNDQFPLKVGHGNKVSKYSVLKDKLKGLPTREPVFTSLTMNWRGAVCGASAEELLGLGLISRRDLKVLSVRCLEFGIEGWRVHRKMTSFSGRVMYDPG
ncbi:hypothetical protein JTE90_016101 [Oedothorax gibbosus]|uniref:Reverse transcriptase n=1 Tax=Oedothorax gibbosus TaxID=931172 RepID=A0AAV6TQX7_9ARAC|nr:hypothetical protein JTE90_016101 [Oedothorax gibbosus]